MRANIREFWVDEKSLDFFRGEDKTTSINRLGMNNLSLLSKKARIYENKIDLYGYIDMHRVALFGNSPLSAR